MSLHDLSEREKKTLVVYFHGINPNYQYHIDVLFLSLRWKIFSRFSWHGKLVLSHYSWNSPGGLPFFIYRDCYTLPPPLDIISSLWTSSIRCLSISVLAFLLFISFVTNEPCSGLYAIIYSFSLLSLKSHYSFCRSNLFRPFFIHERFRSVTLSLSISIAVSPSPS